MASMCGIFGFVMKKPLSMAQVFRVLQKLEVCQYPGEPRPVGGYGAGVAVLLDDGTILSEKVGKAADSPAGQLAEMMKARLAEASVLIAHVRFPSPEFLDSAKFKEAAQPYVGQFEKELTIASVHNGKIENYRELREKLKEHVFESDKVGFVDSEIIPHYFSELINEIKTVDEALYELLCTLKGSNSVAMLHVDEENAFLHLIHKGKTRGLTVWANERNEMIFSSRPEPVMEEFSRILARDKFREKASIKWREDAGLKISFLATFR
jgi:glucosamine 6-phosphate synthetase-like amidotransferase/phosphosugar isomerase protein